MVRMVACHASDPGSNPGEGTFFFVWSDVLSIEIAISHAARRRFFVSFRSVKTTWDDRFKVLKWYDQGKSIVDEN